MEIIQQQSVQAVEHVSKDHLIGLREKLCCRALEPNFTAIKVPIDVMLSAFVRR